MKNELLENLQKPLLTDRQARNLLKRRSWYLSALIALLKVCGSIVLGLIFFFILVFVGHYTGFEDAFRTLFGVQ